MASAIRNKSTKAMIYWMPTDLKRKRNSLQADWVYRNVLELVKPKRRKLKMYFRCPGFGSWGILKMSKIAGKSSGKVKDWKNVCVFTKFWESREDPGAYDEVTDAIFECNGPMLRRMIEGHWFCGDQAEIRCELIFIKPDGEFGLGNWAEKCGRRDRMEASLPGLAALVDNMETGFGFRIKMMR